MEEEDSFVGKKVRFDDWMGDDPEGDKQNIDEIFAANKFSKREKKGHLLLQLQRTYKGDDRFKLNAEFEADDVKQLPSNMLGALSSKEYQDLIAKKKPKKDDEQPATA